MNARKTRRDMLWRAARLLAAQLQDLDWLSDVYPDATDAEIERALKIGESVVAELERRGHE